MHLPLTNNKVSYCVLLSTGTNVNLCSDIQFLYILQGQSGFLFFNNTLKFKRFAIFYLMRKVKPKDLIHSEVLFTDVLQSRCS